MSDETVDPLSDAEVDRICRERGSLPWCPWLGTPVYESHIRRLFHDGIAEIAEAFRLSAMSTRRPIP